MRRIVLLFFMCGFFLTGLGVATADIKLKVLVVNPSPNEVKDVDVRYDLPKEVTEADVVDVGDMNLGYDFDTERYYVYKSVKLKPGEKRLFEVTLKDIWSIPKKKIDFLRKHVSSLLKKLDETKHYDVGRKLFFKINKRLSEIEDNQKETILTTKERMDRYYEDLALLKEVMEDIGMFENLVLDVGGIVEDRVDVPKIMAVSVGPEKEETDKVVTLKVRAYNPSTVKKDIDVRYYLPKEVLPRYIVENGGLDVSYDFKKGVFYVHREKIPLAPHEEKLFELRIKDIWFIPEVDIASLKAHTKNLMLLIKGTEFEQQGQPIADKIFANLEVIVKRQSEDVPFEKHIAFYYENEELFEKTKDLVAQLEKIVNQSGASVGVTIVKAERIRGGGHQVRRIKGYEGVVLIAKSIFRGKAPTIATTWKIIWLIIVFLGIISGAFFALQYSLHRADIIDELTGLVTRTNLLERLRQVHARAEATGRPYSILMMDVDNFKLFNDNYGHAVGDSVLRTVSTKIRQCIDKSFIAGRYGGDEFVVVMPDIDKRGAKAVGERIREAVAKANLRYRGRVLSMTSSIGICSFPEDSSTVEGLFNRVDDAMYLSKKAGGNRVSVIS